jgi:AraC family transcriptional regulator
MQPRLSPGSTYGREQRKCQFTNFILTEASFPSRFEIPCHRHENAFFRLIIEGESSDIAGRRTRLGGASSLVYHPPGEVHSNYWHSQGRSFVVEFGIGLLTRCPDLAVILQGHPDCESGPPVRLALKLYSEFRHMDAVSPLAMEGLALELIAESCRVPLRRERHSPPGWLERAKGLLYDRFAENLSMDEIAGRVGIHPAHLARSFRHHFRCTPGEYVRQLRVDHAREELARSDARLSEIALAAGFSDQSHFTTAFKRLTGLTPAAYRKIYRAR